MFFDAKNKPLLGVFEVKKIFLTDMGMRREGKDYQLFTHVPWLYSLDRPCFIAHFLLSRFELRFARLDFPNRDNIIYTN